MVKLNRRRYSIEQLTQELSYAKFCESGYHNGKERQRMKDFIAKAIKTELTQRQKHCLCAYYLHGKTMNVIAEELGINQSAVSRHIKRAMHNLKSTITYFYM